MSEAVIQRPSSELEKAGIRDRIGEIEAIAKTLPQLEIEVRHHFSKGVYAREMRVPQGAVVIGKIHRFENFNILSQGKVTVVSIDGRMTVEAPFHFVASPGAKRVFFAHTDAVWTVMHGTDEKDLEKIEEIFIAKDYQDLETLTEREVNEIKEAIKCHG